MSVENVQDRRGERVENRRPSEVFLALWRDRTCANVITVDEFAALADVWQQIRELEEIAARERRRERDSELARHRLLQDILRPFDGETAQEPREGQAPPLQTPAEGVSEAEGFPSSAPDGAPSPQGEGSEGVSESDRPMTEGDGELAPTPAKKPNKARVEAGAKGMATRKRNILAALRHARAEGVNLQTVADQVGGLTINSVIDVLDAKTLPMPVWTDVEKALKKLGYPPAAESAGGPGDPSPECAPVRDDREGR